jgi:hypothetical protein
VYGRQCWFLHVGQSGSSGKIQDSRYKMEIRGRCHQNCSRVGGWILHLASCIWVSGRAGGCRMLDAMRRLPQRLRSTRRD